MERTLDLRRAAGRAVEAFEALSPRQRYAMILCDRRGMKATEAGEEMGIEAATVRALTHQARRAVRAALLSSGPDVHDLVREA